MDKDLMQWFREELKQTEDRIIGRIDRTDTNTTNRLNSHSVKIDDLEKNQAFAKGALGMAKWLAVTTIALAGVVVSFITFAWSVWNA